jgi:hypothetical protein
MSQNGRSRPQRSRQHEITYSPTSLGDQSLAPDLGRLSLNPRVEDLVLFDHAAQTHAEHMAAANTA